MADTVTVRLTARHHRSGLPPGTNEVYHDRVVDREELHVVQSLTTEFDVLMRLATGEVLTGQDRLSCEVLEPAP